MSIRLFAARAAVVAFCVTLAARADIVTALGNTSPPFANGSHPTSAAVLAALSGSPSPFNAACGSDIGSNCSATWTFNYVFPALDTITGATLTLGIFDIDSHAPGNQVASYTLGATDLTAALNTAGEGLNGGTGATNSEYDVFTINIPSTAFAALETGSATVSLALQGLGLGVLGNTPYNGAALLFSTLDIQASGPTPEPASVLMLGAGLGALGALRLRHRQSRMAAELTGRVRRKQ